MARDTTRLPERRPGDPRNAVFTASLDPNGRPGATGAPPRAATPKATRETLLARRLTSASKLPDYIATINAVLEAVAETLPSEEA